jgi:hypothetical protein
MRSRVPCVLVSGSILLRVHLPPALRAPVQSEHNKQLLTARRVTRWRFISLVLNVALLSSLSFGQIPNGGFEFWQTDPDSNRNPVGWQTTNSFPLVNVEQYSPACQGNYAMKVKTLNTGFPFPGVAFLHAAYTFIQLPTRFSVCLKSNIMPGDRAYIIVGLMRGDSVIASQDSCTFRIDSTISQFTYREFPLTIQSTLLPDSLIIIVASGLGTGQVGTEIIVDDLAFRTGPASVSAQEPIPGFFSLHQNYPNPFNPSTTIEYEVPRPGTVELDIYNVLGQHVAKLLSDEQIPGRHSVVWNGRNDEGSEVSGGVYFYRLQAGSYFETKKLTLLK